MQISKALLLSLVAAGFLNAVPSGMAAEDSPDAARAREAARKAVDQASTGTVPGLSESVPGDTEEIAKARQALRQKLDQTHAAPGYAPIMVPADPSLQDPEDIRKAREALRQKLEVTGSQRGAPATMRDSKGAPVFTPLPQVASPVATEKQAKLLDLLRRYQADELTPEQYHQERAKLLGAQ